jgi:hypothetical protein
MNEEVLKSLLTEQQIDAIESLSRRYNAKVDLKQVYLGGSGLIPDDWIILNIGNLTFGISAEGSIAS